MAAICSTHCFRTCPYCLGAGKLFTGGYTKTTVPILKECSNCSGVGKIALSHTEEQKEN